MRRSILTGLAVCVMTAALPALAGAAESSPTGTDTAVTATAAAQPAAAAAAAAAVAESESAGESAAPTAGADLAMWNAAPETAEAAETGAPADEHVHRVLNVKKFASGIAARGVAIASALTRNAMKFLGVPYVFGGTSTHGFDCSGYVQHVFAMVGIHLPRTADAQYAVAKKIRGTPQRGDLVFFQTYEPGPSHVGISLGGDKFVSASSSHGVTVSSLHDRYWSARYLGAKRVFE